ncbi:MAG: sugar phosphate isomerase/epimerase, partial [Oscillospiraceae bacterium]|nr:sugar phosphate isomerase/epimerase [Oscillospiraceae bacterium]
YHSWFTEQSVKFWRQFLKSFPADMEICLENVMEEDPYMPIDIVRQVDDRRFGLCLDIGHARTCREGDSDMEWVREMAPYIKHMHIHNNYGAQDQHNPLGDGDIPVEEILDFAADNCDTTFAIENIRAEESVRWLIEKGYLIDRTLEN